MAVGLIGTAASLVLLGPAPMIEIERYTKSHQIFMKRMLKILYFYCSTLLINIAALCLLSVSVSLTLAPTFKALLESAL